MTQAADTKTFMERTFDGDAAEVAAALVEGGQVAHERAQAAQDGSRLKSKQPYGSTYWLALHEEVVSRLADSLNGALVYPPRGAQYKLIVWNGRIILPVKVIDGGSRDGRLRIRTSKLRSALTNVNMPEAPEPNLFEDDDEVMQAFQDEILQVIETARASIDIIASSVLVAAYACSSQGGLQMVEVGIATLDFDGYIDFTDSERLSIIAPPTVGTKPTEAVGESWTNAPKPKPFLEVVDGEGTQTATGDVESDDPDAPDAE